MAGPAERPSVLPADTHIPACFQQLFNGHSRLFTVFRAVQENHIRSLRHGNIHSAEVFPDKVHGIAGVLLKNRPQFFKPLTALRFISADEGVHGKNVHLIIVGRIAVPGDPVPQIVTVNDMETADHARQIKCFAGRIHGDHMLPCPVTDHLRWNVPVAGKGQVRPDLVADHITVVGRIDFHGLLQFPAFPHPAAGIVRRAENRQMDVILL